LIKLEIRFHAVDGFINAFNIFLCHRITKIVVKMAGLHRLFSEFKGEWLKNNKVSG